MVGRHALLRAIVPMLAGTVLAACAGGDSGGSLPNADAKTRAVEIIKDNLSKAHEMRLAGDLAGASKLLGQILLVSPDDPGVIGEYGKVLVEQGRTKDAVAYLQRALLLNGTDWTLYSALGVAEDGNGKSVEAQSAYETALKLKPKDTVVLNNYALSRLLAGDAAGALSLIKQAAEGSKDPKIARNLALIQSLADTHSPAPVTAPGKAAAPTVAVPPPANAQSPKKTAHRPTGRDFAVSGQ